MARHGDAMVRTSTEQLVPQQNQALLPCVYRHRRRALARWIVGTLVAGNATGSALVHVLATAEIARATTLADAWKAWIAALPSTPPLHPQRMHHRWSRPRACGTDLRRWKGAH